MNSNYFVDDFSFFYKNCGTLHKNPYMPKYALPAILAINFISSANGAVIGRWEPNLNNQSSSTGPSPSNWDGVGVGNDNYTGNTGDDLFHYISGTGPAAANQDGRWEDPVPPLVINPATQHYTVQPTMPGAFVQSPSGDPSRTQINLGLIPELNALQNNFYVEASFTASQLGVNTAGGYGVLLGFDHSFGGASNPTRINEGFKLGVSQDRIWFTAFGEIDAFWDVNSTIGGAIQTGTSYNIRFEITDTGTPGQAEYRAFIDGNDLGTLTNDDLNPVVTIDTVDANDGSTSDDLQQDGNHLNSWYIGSAGTGQYFDGSIDFVEIGAIPEPSSATLVLISVLGLSLSRRRWA